ncbi:LysR family transcriptional regulator [Microbacterium fluvii]|uniref:LysR family transcriptional regulator n=1 Tax=Microbacterium fluvii TaxID=415215 RepID=A0ABW2HGE8_9MICO|nr:LysR family transcriptional regulator [Microbacterium fluvii]MCU4673849.1 LysR family transcriptional regulator [Microbacterium fluvii]
MLDLKKLRLLRELQLRGTIAAVAEAVAYSPSAVSQQLAQLERDAGVELLRKSGRNVRLTPAAERLAERAGELLQVMERAEAELHRGDTLTGTVRAAVFQSAMLALLPAALERLREIAPGVRVEVVQREPETALRETWMREFDIVVAEQYPAHAAPHHEGLDRQALTTDAIRLALPPTGHDAVRSVRDARALPWVMEPRGAASRHYAEQQCRAAGFDPDIRFETADLQAHMRLVETGNAVALLPDLIWAGAAPTCRVVELDGSPARTVFTAVRHAAGTFPAVAAFRRVLEQAAAELSAG